MFYVYIIFRSNGSPCYVGKGRGRRYEFHKSFTHNRRLKSLYRREGDLPISIIRDNLDETTALEYEVAFIKAIGRSDLGQGPLFNLTDGGDGVTGWVPSEETRKKLSRIHSGRIIGEEWRTKMSLASSGKAKSQDHAKAIGDALRGKRKSAEHVENMKRAAALNGSKKSEALRAYFANMTPEQKALRAARISQRTKEGMLASGASEKIKASRVLRRVA